MRKYLFLFTIGPVQSFIVQARKTQDLYAGSFLLSRLTDSAMRELSTRAGCKFIFPDNEIKSKPNRFIAEIESDNIENAGGDLKDFVEAEFEKTAKDVLDSLKLTYEGKFEESFRKQIKTHLQVHWIALPLNDNYPQVYAKFESRLGAVKNTRIFQQLGESGRKCSICGKRNVLFYRLTDDESKNGGLKTRKDGLLKKLYVKRDEVLFYEPKGESEELKIQKGEGLCAVCFTRRFADRYFKNDYVKHFPSTAEIAGMDWLEKIDNDRKSDYKKFFNNFDEQLYYEDNLRKEYLEKYGHFKGEESLREAKEQLGEFYKMKVKGENNSEIEIGKPPKYYALVMLDGDNMGKWLSGEFLEDEEKAKLRDFHEKLSKKLGEYADEVEKNIIKPPKGKLIYAGGDDVLAFVNLNHLLPVMNDLRAEFPEFEDMGFKIRNGCKSTASAGVVIAHYKTPLSEVLKWAGKMEEEAKEAGGRDAFAAAVLKHSGAINKTVWKWKYGYDNVINTLDILEEIITMLKNKEISNTFIKNLNIEFSKMLSDEGKWKEKILAETEIRRLVLRSLQRKVGEKEDDFDNRKKKIKNDFLPGLYLLFSNRKTVSNFLSFLNIADFIAGRTE